MVQGWMAAKNVLREVKHQIPSTKSQISSNTQSLKFQKNPFGHLKLELGIYLACLREAATAKAGIWNLPFGICHLESHQSRKHNSKINHLLRAR
jgi:hypothetical protein